jgi:hypothetical protein
VALRALRRGSDVAGAVGVQDADGEVAQAGHGAGGGRTAQARQIRIHVGRRSCATARVPQEAQPSTSTIVSTTITSSSVPRPPRAPGTRAVPPARPPGAYRPSPRVSIVDLQTAVTMARPLPRVVDPNDLPQNTPTLLRREDPLLLTPPHFAPDGRDLPGGNAGRHGGEPLITRTEVFS